MKKFLSIVLILSLLFTLAACGNKSDKDEETTEKTSEVTTEADTEDVAEATTEADTEDVTEDVTEVTTTEANTEDVTEATTESDTDEDVEDLALKPFVDTVMISGDNEIQVGLSNVNYMLYQIKNYYEMNYGTAVWDEITGENITVDQMILEEIKNILVRMEVFQVIAEEQGLELTQEELTAAVTQGKSLYSNYPEEISTQLGVTEDLIIEVLEKETIAGKIYEQMMDAIEYNEADLKAILDENELYQNIMNMGVEEYAAKVRAKHILILTSDESGAPLEGDALNEKLVLIEEIRQRALDGEDFAELASEFTEDPGSKETGGEYTFGRGEMVSEFEETAYNLEIGEISDVVKTSYGYHILKLEERIPAAEEDIQAIETGLENLRNEYISQLEYDQYLLDFAALLDQYNVTFNEDEWAKISMKNELIH